jgi:signal peptidase I
MLKKNQLLIAFSLVFIISINLASAQVKDSVMIKKTDTLKKVTPIQKKSEITKKGDTIKYINPGKLAGKKAIYKSLIIPGWGQLYNNQILVQDYKAKGESTGHFWQKTYTLGKVGLIYGGFTLLTISYIDNTNNYKLFLKEAQIRQENANLAAIGQPQLPQNPDLSRYTTDGIVNAKDVYKRNRQIVIFSMAAVYLANVVDAYVAARLHYFNIDNDLSLNISPTIINTNSMYGFNAVPAIKFSLNL